MPKKAYDLERLCSFMNANFDARFKLFSMHACGLLTKEELLRKLHMLNLTFDVLQAEAFDDKVCSVDSDDLVCDSPTTVRENQLN